MAIRLDGAALAAQIKQRVRTEAAGLPRPPALAVVLAGDEPPSPIFVRGKGRGRVEGGF